MNLGILHTAVTFALVFSALVIFHELGHFLAAKMFRMRVLEFAIGFWTRVARIAYDGQTEYTIRCLPVGGFVRIAGMEADESEEPTPEHTAELAKSGLETTNVSTLHQENAEAAASPNFDPDGFNNRPIFQRFTVILAGPVFSFLLGWLAFCSIGMIGLPDKTVCTVVDFAGSATVAQAAGLHPGDALLGYNDKTPENGTDVIDAIRDSPGKELTLTVRGEDGQVRKIKLTPKPEKDPELDKPVGRIGIQPGMRVLSYRHLSFADSVSLGTNFTGRWFKMIGALIASGAIKDNVGGPITMVRQTHVAAQNGTSASVELLAQLSLSIGVTNLLPIPILDGGHLLLMAIEAIRRRKLSLEWQGRVMMGGFAILAVLVVLILFKDITGLFHHG